MNVGGLLRNSWRITWRNWPLWLLTLLMFVVFLPATLLSGAFGGMAALVTLPVRGPLPRWLIQLRGLPAWGWLLIAVAALVVLVACTAISWLLQAAAMRGAAIAAEHGTFALGEALRLGWRRVGSLLALSLTFGLLIIALSLLPPLVIVLLAGRFEFGVQLMQLAQTGLAPLNIVLGVVLLLVMMAVALEDVGPGKAFGRAWRVFRSGWWGFVLALGIAFAASLALALLGVPVAVLLIVVTAGLSLLNAPVVLAVVLLLACGIVGPIGLFLMLFTTIYTLVLYTLTYRGAARMAGPEAKA
jgi:hypothetical protein